MKVKKYMTSTLTFSVLVGISGLLGYQFNKPAMAHAVSISKVPSTTAADVINNAPFHVARPTNLNIDKSIGFSKMIGQPNSQVEQAELDYVTKNKHLVRLIEIPAKVTHVSSNKNWPINNTTLPNGQPAQYQNNGTFEMLFWYQGGISYELFVSDVSQSKDGNSSNITLQSVEDIASHLK